METARVGDYILYHAIGEGEFGKVRLGRNQATGEHVAVKVIERKMIEHNALTSQVRKEVAIMKLLNHRHIVKLHKVLHSESRLYIIMEYVPGGELFRQLDVIGNHGESVARRYFQQLVDGVDHCHKQGVTHRDLKPENLLMGSSDILKITDFGFSTIKNRKEEGDMLFTQCGTPDYCAPEVIAGRPGGYSGIKADTWSCGVILFAMLTGYLPFDGETDNELLDNIFACKVDYPATMSPGARGLLERILVLDPNKRFSIAHVKHDPWFLIGYHEERDRIRAGLQGQARELITATSLDRPVSYPAGSDDISMAAALTEVESADFAEINQQPLLSHAQMAQSEVPSAIENVNNEIEADEKRKSGSSGGFFSGRLSQLSAIRTSHGSLFESYFSLSEPPSCRATANGFTVVGRVNRFVQPNFEPLGSLRPDTTPRRKDAWTDRNISLYYSAMSKIFRSNMPEGEFRERLATVADLLPVNNAEDIVPQPAFRRSPYYDDVPSYSTLGTSVGETLSFDEEPTSDQDRRGKLKGPRKVSDLLNMSSSKRADPPPVSNQRGISFGNLDPASAGQGTNRVPLVAKVRAASEVQTAPQRTRIRMSLSNDQHRRHSTMERRPSLSPTGPGHEGQTRRISQYRPSRPDQRRPNKPSALGRLRLPSIKGTSQDATFHTRVAVDSAVDILGTILMKLGGSVTMKRDTGQKLRCEISLSDGTPMVLAVTVTACAPTTQAPRRTKVQFKVSKQDRRRTSPDELLQFFENARAMFNDELRTRATQPPA